MFDRKSLLKLLLTAAVAVCFFVLNRLSKSSFTTGLEIGLCFVLLLSIWSKRVRKHHVFTGAFFSYLWGTYFAIFWIESGPRAFGTWLSGTCFIFTLILFVVTLCLKAEPDEDEAD
jgi:hypothetical protein